MCIEKTAAAVAIAIHFYDYLTLLHNIHMNAGCLGIKFMICFSFSIYMCAGDSLTTIFALVSYQCTCMN